MEFRSQSRLKVAPIPIRGHTLLCLQGFVGEGYDPMFTAHMAAIHQRLTFQPHLLVKVIVQPDTFCHCCPHLSGNQGCSLHGIGTEARMVEQDYEVMRRIDIQNNEVLPWSAILQKIRNKMIPSMLDEICGSCPWLPRGYCKEGLLELKSGSKSHCQDVED